MKLYVLSVAITKILQTNLMGCMSCLSRVKQSSYIFEGIEEPCIYIGGPRLPLLFTSHSYHHLEGHFLAEMAGQQIGLNGRETKLA